MNSNHSGSSPALPVRSIRGMPIRTYAAIEVFTAVIQTRANYDMAEISDGVRDYWAKWSVKAAESLLIELEKR